MGQASAATLHLIAFFFKKKEKKRPDFYFVFINQLVAGVEFPSGLDWDDGNLKVRESKGFN